MSFAQVYSDSGICFPCNPVGQNYRTAMINQGLFSRFNCEARTLLKILFSYKTS